MSEIVFWVVAVCASIIVVGFVVLLIMVADLIQFDLRLGKYKEDE